MSQVFTTKTSCNHPGIIRSVVIAAVAAFALGALCAFVSKVAYSSPNAPVATSGSAPLGM